MKKQLIVALMVSLLLTSCPVNDTNLSADEQVRRALNATIAAPHYVVDAATATSTGGAAWTVEYQAPDRYHVKMDKGPEIIVIGNKSWGYDPDKGWITLVKPIPDPKSLLIQFEPSEIVGFTFTQHKPLGCELFKGDLGAIRLEVCIVANTTQVKELVLRDGTGTLSQLYDFNKPVSISAP
jgi:hypothetical protein